MSKINTAVFPVAGLGSRFYPATKATPKEMLPIVDKPLIQYAVEEAYQAGITHMVFITSHQKRAIEDHFDKSHELEAALLEKKKLNLLKKIEDISPDDIKFTYIRQAKPSGLGDAIACSAHIVKNEPFAVILADDLLLDKMAPCLSSMIEIYQKKLTPVIAVQNVAREDTSKFGIVDILDEENYYSRILNIIEKPKPEHAPSTLGVIGRYILTPDIFSFIQETSQGAQGEIQLTDAVALLLKQKPAYAYHFLGKRYDCGSKLGFLKATVEYGLQHSELKDEFLAYLSKLSQSLETENHSTESN